MATTDEKVPLLESGQSKSSSNARKRKLISSVVIAALIVAVLVVIVTLSVVTLERNPNDYQPASGVYTAGAVASSSGVCSQIGSDMMQIHNGSAVDAAIATTLCIGVVESFASGIGGGHFMVIHDVPRNKAQKVAVAINAREMAPANATRDMLRGLTSFHVKNIAVPGEVCGLYKAWQMFGRLSWKQLLQPTINLCRHGYIVTPVMAERLKMVYLKLYNRSTEFYRKPDGSSYDAGDVMTRPELARTLETLRDEGPLSFYNGSLAADIIKDVADAGGILTLEDLRNYQCHLGPTLQVPLKNNSLQLHTTPLPSGGPAVQYMLRILEGFPDSELYRLYEDVDFFQTILETFKFGSAMRSHLADPTFVNMEQEMNNMTSEDFIADVRKKIDLRHTHDISYYGSTYLPLADHGTSHISVTSAYGGAVSITSSVNIYFGSGLVGRRTGIIFNNEMDDFSTPESSNSYGFSPSSANFIQPGKRPLSSMAPIIVLRDDVPRLVTGGAGGSQISTEVTLTSYLSLYAGATVEEAVSFPRVHHQLLPDQAVYELAVSTGVVHSLADRGHVMTNDTYLAVINAIERHCHVTSDVCISRAAVDSRRGGAPAGWNT